MSKAPYNPSKDIPDQSGRVFFVTGGTTGLGAGFITLLAAKSPAQIFFSGRNAAKATELVSKLKDTAPNTKFVFIECDLTSLASVQKAAKEFLSQSERLDVLMCNAGVMALEPSLSKDGYEIQFATNHLGHALLIKLLQPCLLATAALPDSDVRIISMTSMAHKSGPSNGIDFDTLKTTQASLGGMFKPSKWMRYNQSKLANVIYAQELARRYPSIKAVSVHPGFVRTDLHFTETLFDRVIKNVASGGHWTPLEEGPYSQTWAATTPKENLENGAYYEPVGIKPKPIALAKDRNLAEKLWKWTENELASYS
jgi:NAD(P)-dependent dehydrogenase (short-subunit alcohol dehydrogenase family)